MFDDYSAGLPLTIVVILENLSVAWIYGTKRYNYFDVGNSKAASAADGVQPVQNNHCFVAIVFVSGSRRIWRTC